MRDFRIPPIFSLMLVLFISCADDKPLKVALQPFDNFDPSLTDTVAVCLRRTFPVSIHTFPTKPIPKTAFIHVRTARYRADKIISILKTEKPDSIDHILALTDKDISITKKDEHGNTKEPKEKYEDWGIFGLGYRPGPSCIISTYRIRKTSHQNFIARLKKISIHEVGHNLGLKHCDSKACVMRDAAETIKTIDMINVGLCNVCKSKIQ